MDIVVTGKGIAMKAHATGTQWFKFNPMTVLALAAGILLAVTVLAMNDVVELPFTSGGQSTTSRTSTEPQVQLPAVDIGSGAQTMEQMRFLEQNLYLPDGALSLPFGGPGPADEPTLSVDRMIFLEQNIWEYAGLPATDAPISYPADQAD